MLNRLGERFDQFAKIDAVLGEVVEHQPFAAEELLDVHELHNELAVGDDLLGLREDSRLLVQHFVAGAFVLGGDAAEDAADRLLAPQVLAGTIGGITQDFAPFGAAMAFDDDLLATAELLPRLGGEVRQMPHQAKADDVAMRHGEGGIDDLRLTIFDWRVVGRTQSAIVNRKSPILPRLYQR